jgi:amino acid adenylation domain-containing protein
MQAQLSNLIGFFVNTLVLRSNSESCETFIDFLNHIKQVNLDAQSHQDMPFESLVEHLHIPRSTTHAPLFQMMFSMDTNEQQTIKLPGLRLTQLGEGEESSAVQAKFDLTLDAVISVQKLHLTWTYDSQLFKAATIERLNRHFCQLLGNIVAAPETSLARLSMLNPSETESLVKTIDSLPVAQQPANQAPENILIHQLFGHYASVAPEHIALELADEQWTYAELDARSNQLANYLVGQGVKQNDLVGIAMERSMSLVVAVLAILQAGGAYVPLDPAYPQARLDHMITDSGIQLLLSESHLLAQFEAHDVNQVALDSITAQLAACEQTFTAHRAQSPDSPAYVIYTSGSTGKPKGVILSHRNWWQYTASARRLYDIQGAEKVFQFSSISFDIFIEELSLSILSGGTLVLPPDNQLPSNAQFWQRLRHFAISIVTLPTAFWHQLCLDEQLAVAVQDNALRLVICGGEAMTLAHLQRWQGAVCSTVRLFNTYGPTETTVIATGFEASGYQVLGHGQDDGIPIGVAQFTGTQATGGLYSAQDGGVVINFNDLDTPIIG